MKTNKPVVALVLLLNWHTAISGEQSTCYGTTKNGRLENGVEIPNKGKNFIAYSYLASVLGRTYVHSTVNDVVLDAYQSLEKEQPGKVYKYAETGYQQGGSFKPHKTHQNGLSIDFMVPVINRQGESVQLPTNMLNKYGYDIEFDENTSYREYKIDFESMGAHIVALHQAASRHNIKIWRVIFDPKLQPYLLKTKYGEYIRNNIQLSNKRSWVRHDEHYHVDFQIPCLPV